MINGIKVVLSLPSGITVRSTSDDVNPSVQVTDAGVVAASGVAKDAMAPIATYRVASGAAPGKVTISLISAGGFGTGEFVTITRDIADGYYPKAADFRVADFKVVDLNGTPIGGLTAKLAVDIH